VAHVAECRSAGPGQGGPWLRGVEKAGHGGPVQAPGLGLVPDDAVGPAVDLGGRGEDVPAAGAEVQVLARQPPRWLVAAGEVGVQPAAGRGDDRADGLQHALALELAEGREAVARLAVLVDVQDIGARPAGGDRKVGGGLAAPPRPDPVRVSAGVAEAVPGRGFLAAGPAREHQPTAAGVAQRPPNGVLGLSTHHALRPEIGCLALVAGPAARPNCSPVGATLETWPVMAGFPSGPGCRCGLWCARTWWSRGSSARPRRSAGGSAIRPGRRGCLWCGGAVGRARTTAR
jgi:hypothetical protein